MSNTYHSLGVTCILAALLLGIASLGYMSVQLVTADLTPTAGSWLLKAGLPLGAVSLAAASGVVLLGLSNAAGAHESDIALREAVEEYLEGRAATVHQEEQQQASAKSA